MSKQHYKDAYHTIIDTPDTYGASDTMPFMVKRSNKATLPDGKPYKNASLPRCVESFAAAMALVKSFTESYDLPVSFETAPSSPLVNRPVGRPPKPKAEPKPVGRPKKRQKPGPKPQPKRKTRSDKAPFFPEWSIGRFYCYTANEVAAVYRCYKTPQEMAYAAATKRSIRKPISAGKLMYDFDKGDCIVVRLSWRPGKDGEDKPCGLPLTIGRGSKMQIRKFGLIEAEEEIERLFNEEGRGMMHPARYDGTVSLQIGFSVEWADKANPYLPFAVYIPKIGSYLQNGKGHTIAQYGSLWKAIEAGNKALKEIGDPMTKLAEAVKNDDGGETSIRITNDKLMEVIGKKI